MSIAASEPKTKGKRHGVVCISTKRKNDSGGGDKDREMRIIVCTPKKRKNVSELCDEGGR